MGIRLAREKMNLTQAQVAEALGIQQSAVAQWESGETKPRADKLLALAKLFGCTIDELLKQE